MRSLIRRHRKGKEQRLSSATSFHIVENRCFHETAWTLYFMILKPVISHGNGFVWKERKGKMFLGLDLYHKKGEMTYQLKTFSFFQNYQCSLCTQQYSNTSLCLWMAAAFWEDDSTWNALVFHCSDSTSPDAELKASTVSLELIQLTFTVQYGRQGRDMLTVTWKQVRQGIRSYLSSYQSYSQNKFRDHLQHQPNKCIRPKCSNRFLSSSVLPVAWKRC